MLLNILCATVTMLCRGEGKISGKVLVYKNPGKHRGDVHVFDAIWDSQLDPYVGASQYTIFFSVLGDRPVVDEMANSDLDGDLYWVCNNEKARNSCTVYDATV
jgi:RNA-dependent RNA polymerase